MIAAWCDRFGADVKLKAKEPSVERYLDSTGFRQTVEDRVTINSIKFDGEHFVALTRVDREDRAEADKVASRLIELFKSELDLTREQRIPLHIIFSEMIENVYRHSESNYPAYVMAQAYPSARKFHFVVVDTGIGVYGSFRKSQSREVKQRAVDEKAAIEMALEKRVTSKTEGHAGYGLFVYCSQFLEILL